jgi:CRP-like cAMP-binding protein
VAEQCKVTALERGEVLAEAGRPFRRVWFPTTMIASIVTILDDGSVIEMATVGDEGVVGVEVVLSPVGIQRRRCVVQIPGGGLVMDADVFLDLVQHHAELESRVDRYIRAHLAQTYQQVACNGRHSAPQRCARWLLMTHDRVGRDDFYLTHEFLAQMLAVRRATVTNVARKLQEAGYLTYHRGQVKVLDRAGLEAASCECYAQIRWELDRALA